MQFPDTVRILLLDDDPDMATELSDSMGRDPDRKFSVTQETELDPALHRLLRDTYDIVFVDYDLGNLKGDIFAYTATLSKTGMPVVLLTGFPKHSLDTDTRVLLARSRIHYLDKAKLGTLDWEGFLAGLLE